MPALGPRPVGATDRPELAMRSGARLGRDQQHRAHGRHRAEVFDGDAPFTPRGCVAQAWSVAETLRAWQTLSRSTAAPRRPAAKPRPR